MRRFILIIGAFVSALSLSSCIKEGREGCPCYLLFAHEGFRSNGYEGNVNLFVFEGGQKTKDALYYMEDMVSDRCDVAVNRGHLNVRGIAGIAWMQKTGASELVIPYGHDCDPIYSFSDDMLAQREREPVFAELHKQHACVYMDVNVDVSTNVLIKVTGNTNAVDLKTMTPVEGYFGYVTPRNDEGIFTFRLPRQKDPELYLEIWCSEDEDYRPSDHSMTGCTRITSLNLGAYINGIGYDWTADSLADIYINVDFINSVMTMTVRDWDIYEMFSIDV